jgi:hypothetical protein
MLPKSVSNHHEQQVADDANALEDTTKRETRLKSQAT